MFGKINFRAQGLIFSAFSFRRQLISVILFKTPDETSPSEEAIAASEEKKRAVVIDLISDTDDEEEDSNPKQNASKKSCQGSPKKTQSSTHGDISSTSDSPELMIIDLE